MREQLGVCTVAVVTQLCTSDVKTPEDDTIHRCHVNFLILILYPSCVNITILGNGAKGMVCGRAALCYVCNRPGIYDDFKMKG